MYSVLYAFDILKKQGPLKTLNYVEKMQGAGTTLDWSADALAEKQIRNLVHCQWTVLDLKFVPPAELENVWYATSTAHFKKTSLYWTVQL